MLLDAMRKLHEQKLVERSGSLGFYCYQITPLGVKALEG
jgi:hypothetical protein